MKGQSWENYNSITDRQRIRSFSCVNTPNSSYEREWVFDEISVVENEWWRRHRFTLDVTSRAG